MQLVLNALVSRQKVYKHAHCLFFIYVIVVDASKAWDGTGVHENQHQPAGCFAYRCRLHCGESPLSRVQLRRRANEKALVSSNLQQMISKAAMGVIYSASK